MTKPAAVFLQLNGVMFMLLGIIPGCHWLLVLGLCLFVWGGVGIRRRIK